MEGIKETKELAAFVGLAINAAIEMADKKSITKTAKSLIEAAMASKAAFDGFRGVASEMKDLDNDEQAELIKIVSENLNINMSKLTSEQDAHLTAIIGNLINFFLDGEQLFQETKNLVKEIKANKAN